MTVTSPFTDPRSTKRTPDTLLVTKVGDIVETRKFVSMEDAERERERLIGLGFRPI